VYIWSCNESYMTTFYVWYEIDFDLLKRIKAKHFVMQGPVISEQ
jgi:hypothetical protein